MKQISIALAILLLCGLQGIAQQKEQNHAERFEQLGGTLRSPNVYRTASGAPGHMYWQQKADHEIEVELNDENQSITGWQKVTYHNYSPDPLSYLWIQLDQNERAKDSNTPKVAESKISQNMSMTQLQGILWHNQDLGYKIISVKDISGRDIPVTINKTMMRVNLPEPLKPGAKMEFTIDWTFNIHDRISFIGGRPGYEYFEKDGNYLYTMAEWFPRMAVYSDFQGWQNKQFMGKGEFALTFGDYKVKITVPADHMVGATGVLQNPKSVLSQTELQRWEEAKKSYDKPVIIRTQSEAEKLEKGRSKDKKSWIYHAENVRDFAWTSSRKFIWDAMAVKQQNRDVMAMSYYGKEGNPLWEQYSTKVVAHTIKSYGAKTFDYPYPVAISVEASNGMEYPMICFNYGRPDADGTYSDAVKYGMISVIIHEVGHNFFPMIVNSDERQWTWMDEGLNTFMQFMAEQEWDRNYPSRRGPAHKIVPYMRSEKHLLEPIMTNSENIIQFGPNAYAKPATALNILRETVMGRDLFDFAFKQYAKRWMFKHPTPDDFFRTMEDASAVDLDWFWRGWFFKTEPVDISLESVSWFKLDNRSPAEKKSEAKKDFEREESYVSKNNNLKDNPSTVVESDPSTRDFYNSYNPFSVTPDDEKSYSDFVARLSPKEKELLNSNLNFYELRFRNIGGQVMPLILQFNFTDGSSEIERIPAEIWRLNESEVSKVFAKNKEVKSIVLDPLRETADIDEENNYLPRTFLPSRFELFKGNPGVRGVSSGDNPMKKAKKN
ncbi:MAG: aminopeptidase [Sphingobacteriales bacterium 17-39-43]|uniref:M1 family metallopeptidase n=1 Tax=Daejeonella sp. TaxID=2805397 RepID=UPI000BC87050|nr:M1 family metallopeptidase [Daejeonella sp.]OYZ32149.1 MAG: aminopeptidase [Sphingobacteriales bacterium 16-39-50]OZA25493.1 MAG: aminopeptidase [Sphingobacteriales bacterium 17-39-43]HQT22239.1 M1 family metallopeptidase [Daejeonella sp.]HQT57546.1 M1 family metallopeptidase [Daejeonella sp.]